MFPFLAALSAFALLHSSLTASAFWSDEAAARSSRIRNIDACPPSANSRVRHSAPRLPGHMSLPTRKCCVLWDAGLSRLVRKERLSIFVSQINTPIHTPSWYVKVGTISTQAELLE